VSPTFGGEIGAGRRPCLVIVDVTYGFTDPELPLGTAMDEAVAANARLLAAARANDIPVVFTTVEYDEPDGGRARHFVSKAPALLTLRPGSRASRVDDRIAPAAGELVLVKLFASAFAGTGLTDHLDRLAVDTVVVTGVSTSGCVRATVVDALQNGFRPLLVEDAVADRNPAAAAATLYDVRAKYGDIVTADAAVALFARPTEPGPGRAALT
jgi:maleamate amidohydrolase